MNGNAMKKRVVVITAFVLAMALCACTVNVNVNFPGEEGKQKIAYHFADREEAVKCYLSNEEYFEGFSPCDIQYKTQNINGTLEDVKEFGSSQMQEFTEEEKEILSDLFAEMEEDLSKQGYVLPDMDEITLIRSTQGEESGSGAYTHGTQIYMGQYLMDIISDDDESTHLYGKSIMWHEIFHCLTRSNPDFRKEMYEIIGFTIGDEDFKIPPSVYEKFISNPDVEHHNSYASFNIDGERKDCFMALIAEKPFKEKGDSFFDCMAGVLVPTDGSDVYYHNTDADNFFDLIGRNTGYVIDPEECMADNFSYAITYGRDGMDYETPEIIDAVIEKIKKL